jgi:hypothetical protein
MTDWLFQGDFATRPTDGMAVVLSLLLAFLGGHMVAWVYMKTHTGLSYSRSFVNSLIVIPMIVAMVMMVLSNNLVTAFGMMAVFAIVRFRNVLRDTLDTTYVLSVIVVGMACGTQKYATAILGCLLFVVVMIYLWYTGFGMRHRYDVIVNLHWARALAELKELMGVLHRHSQKTICASQRSSDASQGTDLSYRILLRDPSRVDDLLTEVRAIQGVSRVTSLQAQDESEL